MGAPVNAILVTINHDIFVGIHSSFMIVVDMMLSGDAPAKKKSSKYYRGGIAKKVSCGWSNNRSCPCGFDIKQKVC